MLQGRGNVAGTLAAATGGGLAAVALGVPAGALLGSSLTVALLSTLTGKGAVPDRLRDAGFATIGVALGGGIDADLAARLPGWMPSLALLVLSLVATLWLGAIALQRLVGIDRETAVLATAPGTMSNVIALAIEGRGDVGIIMALQVMRVLFLVLMVPPLATLMDVHPGTGLAPPAVMAPLPLAVLLACGLGAGLAGQRLRVPASCFLFGLLISAAAHALGWVEGAVPDAAMFAGLVIAGGALGTRARGMGGTAPGRLALAGAVMLGVTLSVSIAFALLAAALTGLPLVQLWVAFAPGGVEVMAAIGLSLGYDPAFVALHHFARILALVVLVPLALGRVRAGERRGSPG